MIHHELDAQGFSHIRDRLAEFQWEIAIAMPILRPWDMLKRCLFHMKCTLSQIFVLSEPINDARCKKLLTAYLSLTSTHDLTL